MESIRTIKVALKIKPEVAKEVKRICGLNRRHVPDLENYPATKKWVNSCYSLPSIAEVQMEMVNEAIGGFGVDCIRDDGEILFEYVNMGETYSPTVLYDVVNNKFFLYTYGDVVEQLYKEN